MRKYSFDLQKLRALYEYDQVCSLCGSNHRLEFHHIKHKRGNAKSIFNSIRICNTCHRKYGSSSADDTIKHLNIGAMNHIVRVDNLIKRDLTFDLQKFITQTDIDFLKENWDNYSDKIKIWVTKKKIFKEN